MKIAIAVDLLRPNGAGVMALTQAALLAPRHQVMVLGAGGAHDPSTVPEAAAEIRTFLPSDLALDQAVDAHDHQRLREGIQEWLIDELAAFDPDVVVAHNLGRMVDQPGAARLSRRYAFAVVLHDEWFFTDTHYVIEGRGAVRFSFEPYRERAVGRHAFDHLWQVQQEHGRMLAVAPSRWIMRRWRAVYPRIPCVHLPNPVDEELFRLQDPAQARASLGIDPGTRVVGFVGDPRNARKGFDLLRESLVNSDGPPVLLLIAGGRASFLGRTASGWLLRGGFIERHVRATSGPSTDSERLGDIGDRTVMIAGAPRATIPLVYGAADLIVHPSMMENLPTVPIESGLSGTRCLASNVGGTSEALAEEDSLFEPSIRPTGLIRRIDTELERVRGDGAGERARRRDVCVSRFSPSIHVPRLEHLLDQLAEDGAP